MKKRLIAMAVAMIATTGFAQIFTSTTQPEKTYKYRVYLHDKADCGYSVENPEAFLSQKAIERRKKFNLAVDEHDLPVSANYIAAIQKTGARVCNVSKWNNTAVVEVKKEKTMDKVSRLAFVDSVKLVYSSPKSITLPSVRDNVTDRTEKREDFYGAGKRQIELINGQKLHEAGFKGEGMTIAVIDGGFHNADKIAGLASVNILGTKNFVRPDMDTYLDGSHGMMVLSCIGANVPNVLVGTAPGASFYLLQSEDGATEFPVEEDNWCAAVEFADSLGVDVITSSLGYNTFDDVSLSHTHATLDGVTAINSRSASLAASRGLMVLNSAGNSGKKPWRKIGTPADGKDMLAVGAVRADGYATSFTSQGFAADGRVKPDAMAMGQSCRAFDTDGSITHVDGTSFSCPILCGAVTCLMQAFPDKRPELIIDAIHRAGDRYDNPDEIYGYGIPDMWKAYEILKNQ